VLWSADEVPARSNSDMDFKDAAFAKHSNLANDKGIVVRVVDFAPGGIAVRQPASFILTALADLGKDGTPDVISGLCSNYLRPNDTVSSTLCPFCPSSNSSFSAWSQRGHQANVFTLQQRRRRRSGGHESRRSSHAARDFTFVGEQI